MSKREVVIDYEYLLGTHGEEVIKELFVASTDVRETLRFLPPYRMDPHSNDQNGLCWDNESIAYGSLFQVVAGATANFTNLFAKGTEKCKVLTELLGRCVRNLDSFGCPERKEFKMTTGCSLPCHKHPDKSCAARNAYNLYGWLRHHTQEKECVKCPKDNTRHTAILNSGIKTE